MPEQAPAEVTRDFEEQLSSPLFFGVPLGPALSEALHRYAFQYSTTGALKPPPLDIWWSRARYVKHRLRPRIWKGERATIPSGRILVTWFASTPRYDGLIEPILHELDPGSFAVIHEREEVSSRLQPDVPRVRWKQIMDFDVKIWRSEYELCRPDWERTLRALCRRFDLPSSTHKFLSLSLMVASQRVLGCLDFLARAQPAGVLTEYDRNHLWSCLILAARRLGIPSATLVHGVIEQNAFAFSPVIADTILCWGELDKSKLLAAGEPEDKVVVAGCPRLTQTLSATREEGRAKLGLDTSSPLVMFVSTPEPQESQLVELFCTAVDLMEGIVGLVRLHASDSPNDFRTSRRRHPRIRFSPNAESTVDEALAAADIVVTCRSGMGSDALVKGRSVVVLNPEEVPQGTDFDLIVHGGCPHARTPEELAGIIAGLVRDETTISRSLEAARRYATGFCAAYGVDSARRIAAFVKESTQ